MMHSKYFSCITGLLFILPFLPCALHGDDSPATIASESTSHSEIVSDAESENSAQNPRQIRIADIVVHGNKTTTKNAILSYSPYKVGEIFDPLKTRLLIKKLYFGIGRFRNVSLKAEVLNQNEIRLHIIVEEKKILKDVLFHGNRAIKDDEILKKVTLDMPGIDPEQVPILAQNIKRLYDEKGYYKADIASELKEDAEGAATIEFTITEGVRALVKQIMFEGNEFATAKELRGIILTKEDWVLGFMDGAGTFIPDRLEADKHMIEQFYQNSGFLRAKVINVIVKQDEVTQAITLTFVVEEGERYKIGTVKAPGNEILPEDFLTARLPLRPGNWYSRKRVADSIKFLESLWGNYGYIFAHVDPSVEPNPDTKTVDISFFSDLGNKIILNRLNFIGNKKTRDKVIRRRVALVEGEIITQQMMDLSKSSVESLGYFEQQDGVNWKLRRIDNDSADLDLILKEAKTGQFNFSLGYGGQGANFGSPASGINVKLNAADRNLMGTGTDVNFDASFSKDEQSFNLHIAQPWLMDKPIAGMFDIYHKRPTYTNFRNINGAINELITGGQLTAGVIIRPSLSFFSDVQLLGSLGVDNVRYQKRPEATFINRFPDEPIARAELQRILNNEFSGGTFLWLAQSLEQNQVNHPIHPSRGQKWRLNTKFAVPTLGGQVSFYKAGFDFNWFTPLIGERDLVFRFHGFAGITGPFGCHAIPYSELFHVGGPGSVRGFLFSQIGPRFLGDPLGAQKAFYINTELIFPITSDFSFKGVVFYDGGAGFDAPYTHDSQFIRGNRFDYRHAVGFGVRIYNPMPIKVDWGFKIDPRIDRLNPDRSETPYEVHFGMSYDW